MRQVTCRRVVFLYFICTGKYKETFLLPFLIAYIFMYLLSDLERITSKFQIYCRHIMAFLFAKSFDLFFSH